MMSMRFTVGIGLAAIGVCSLVVPRAERDDAQRLHIAGGVRDKVKNGAEDPREAVGWVTTSSTSGSMTRTGTCSGTLVAPDLVLTALHCFIDSMPTSVEPSKKTFSVGWKRNKPIDTVNISSIQYLRKPRQRSATESSGSFSSYYASDMVFAHLERAVKGEVAPLPFDCVRESDGKQTLQAVGYGLRPFWGSPSYRRRAAVKANDMLIIPFRMTGSTGDYPNLFANGLEIFEAPDSKETGMTCTGDSGGPLLALRGKQLTVIGSLSSGDEGCKKKGKSTYSMITDEVAKHLLKSVENGWPKQITASDSCKYGSHLGL